MISTKMKKDAAKINSEIKILQTKMPLLFHNYDYLNEDAKVVLNRRYKQLDEMKCVKVFLEDNAKYSEVLNDCEKEFKNINDELKGFGIEIVLDESEDASANNSNDSNDESSVPSNNGVMVDVRQNITISRENSFVPDTPAIKYRKNLKFVKD